MVFLGTRLAADHLVCRFMLHGALAGFCLAVLPSAESIGIIAYLELGDKPSKTAMVMAEIRRHSYNRC
jgi:hypothetical protein